MMRHKTGKRDQAVRSRAPGMLVASGANHGSKARQSSEQGCDCRGADMA
eukprot:CAMPEP_0115278362 /NCGR_PEP_ID=MMETSP0270-20121206/57718_1 /TAXON_ID=71861 /ORGANISM="Scrippsiella trochoidea, Strain CCMP3099" /LENGTH=48 /DNA_ID= /DNA_START= /DNA_END= /DNA_ORIENTATION=